MDRQKLAIFVVIIGIPIFAVVMAKNLKPRKKRPRAPAVQVVPAAVVTPVAPILAAGVLVGLIVSIFQSITSIQDQTITFVPKILVMIVVAAILLPWIAARLVDYSAELLWLISG